MNTHVPITQLQRWATHGQSCFIYTCYFPLHIPDPEYFEANPKYHNFSYKYFSMYHLRKRTFSYIITPLSNNPKNVTIILYHLRYSPYLNSPIPKMSFITFFQSIQSRVIHCIWLSLQPLLIWTKPSLFFNS